MPGSVSLAMVGYLAQDLFGDRVRILLAGGYRGEPRFPACAARELLEPLLDPVLDDCPPLPTGTVRPAQVPRLGVFEIRAVFDDAVHERLYTGAFGRDGLLDRRRPRP